MNLHTFLATYTTLTADNLDSLDAVYSHDVVFIDPAHEFNFLGPTQFHFSHFECAHHQASDGDAFVQWRMTFSHPGLKSGADIVVDGASYLRFNDENKVFYHRDYFDLGSLVYEHLPLLGKIITSIKGRLGQ